MMTKPHKIALHIGHFKTGTTALQVFFAFNQEQLAEQGLIYSQVALEHCKHSLLAHALLHSAGVVPQVPELGPDVSATRLWEELFAEARTLPPEATLLVSSEEFIRLGIHPEAFATLAALLDRNPDIDLSVIAYLRQPHEHLLSWYNQLVKLGEEVGSFETAVRSQMESIHWDYAAALTPWIELVGEDRVILQTYTDALRNELALFESFMSIFGLTPPEDAYLAGRDPNPRIDARALDLARGYQRQGANSKVANNALKRARRMLALEDGGLSMLNAPEFEQIRDAAQSGIETLSQLKNAHLDAELLLADLPRARPEAEQHLASALSLLASEIAQQRLNHRQLVVRMNKLEKRVAELSKADRDA